ncbi:MAG: bifunctional 4-hydroxy-3-methylbut-2-enyl diphosphate reductase/30S ribosomal protein S1 [Saccharofermentanales bacterium]
MNIEVIKTAGFCFGVDNAVKHAYEITSGINEPGTGKSDESAKKIYMLGELIHNKGVVKDILDKGMCLVHDIDEIEDDSTVLIRAHGISPESLDRLEKKGCEIVDCTCPFVFKIHEIVKKACSEGKNIILVGDRNHPEILGINGECDNASTIIENIEEAENFEKTDKQTIIVAQTTFLHSKYKKICEILKKKIANLEIFDTICITTENRQKETEELAGRSDIMIVIGSKESSNTRKLVDICLKECRETYLVENPQDLDVILKKKGIQSMNIGITAGASTPESNIREVIGKMNEDVVSNNQQEQDNLYFSEYVENISQLHRGSTVRGTIIRSDNEFVYVDVHDKSEGRIPVREFTSDPDFDLAKAVAEHDEVDVYVRSIRNTELGKEIILSKAKNEFSKFKDVAENAFKDKEPVTVTVVNVVKDGVIANYCGVDIYIHRTQLEAGNVEDLEQYKNKSFEILITQFDSDKKRLRVSGSRRILLNKARKEKADLIWSELEVNKVFKGVVRSLTDFGAFVDIGGVDGLVHVSELSWNRIRHPSEVVKPGDEIEVYIKDFDVEKHRISLGYKKADLDPYQDVESKFPAGTIVEGKVVRMFPFGAFIEIAPGVDALCHISQISNTRLVKPSDALTENMIVHAKVLEVSNESRRISVSIKEVEPIEPIRKHEKETIAEAAPEEIKEAAPQADIEEAKIEIAPEAVKTDEVPEEVKVEETAEETKVEEAAEEAKVEEAAEEPKVEAAVEETKVEAEVETTVESTVEEAKPEEKPVKAKKTKAVKEETDETAK